MYNFYIITNILYLSRHCFMFYFISLDVMSFSSLYIFLTLDLFFFFAVSKPNIWAIFETVYMDHISFCVCGLYFHVFFLCVYISYMCFCVCFIFFVENWIFKIYMFNVKFPCWAEWKAHNRWLTFLARSNELMNIFWVTLTLF